MALDATDLAAALAPEIKDCFTDHLGAVDNGTLAAFAAAFASAIADKVVEHIKANAVVTPTALVAPLGGGPVTGTGKVT